MGEEIQKKDFKVCLIPVDAQPPTFGLAYSIKKMAYRYDEIIICIRDDPILIPTEVLVEMFTTLFDLPKFMVISHKQNFETLIEFPQDLPFFTHVATVNDRAYVNLAMKGYGVFLIPRAMGYDEGFHRLAWMQSHALDVLRSNTKQVSVDRYKEKEATIGQEGD